MMLSLAVSLIWLLALLAASAHVQATDRRPVALVGMLLVFAVVLVSAVRLSPQPNWVGVLVGLTAIWQLIGGPLERAGNWLGATCAALAAALQVAGGVQLWLAALISAAALLIAFAALPRRSPRGGFRDPALILTALVTPALGLGGDLVYGWHSAAILSRDAVAQPDTNTPAWAIAIVALALLGGVLRGIWKKR